MPVRRRVSLADVITPELARWVAARLGTSLATARVVLPLALFTAAFVVAYLVQTFVVRGLGALARRSKTRVDDIVSEALRGPIVVIGALVGTSLALLVTPAPASVHDWAARGLAVVLLAGFIVLLARILGGLVTAYGEHASVSGASQTLARRITVGVIYVVGTLLILDNLGVSITPLLTTLGLAGLALALALQDTLSNFFAGIWVQADRPIDVGHYVRIEELNVEGFVVTVGWRTTKIRTLANNHVVVPNARIASSVITDFDLPEPRMSLLVNVPVSHRADPREVERVVLDEAMRATKEVPGLLAEPAPFVRFIPGFTDRGIEFTLICQVKTFVDQYLAQHEIRHRLAERLRAEGISLAYPIRTIIPAEGGAEARGLAPRI